MAVTKAIPLHITFWIITIKETFTQVNFVKLPFESDRQKVTFKQLFLITFSPKQA